MKFFQFLALHNYCEGLMIFTALIAFIYSLRHYGRNRAFRIIPYYIGACLFQTAIVDFIWYVSPRGDRFANSLELISTVAMTIFEFGVFSLLIIRYTTGAGRRLIIKLNAGIFFVLEIFLFLRSFPRIPLSFDLLEPIALLPPCIIYFYELFTTMNTKALKDRPSVWVAIGIIYLSLSSLTLLLSRQYMGRFGDGAYAVGNLLYCVLFVLFMRAYKCSPEEWVAA